MVSDAQVRKLTQDAKAAFEGGDYQTAAKLFDMAARGYEELKDWPSAAELKNNLSVALLKMGRAQAALEATLGTDAIFATAGDVRRQGMAVGNQAAALEDLRRMDEALAAYERSSNLLAEAGEGDLRSLVLKAAAGIQLRRGKLADSGIRMIGALEAKDNPSLFERLLKLLLRVIPR